MRRHEESREEKEAQDAEGGWGLSVSADPLRRFSATLSERQNYVFVRAPTRLWSSHEPSPNRSAPRKTVTGPSVSKPGTA